MEFFQVLNMATLALNFDTYQATTVILMLLQLIVTSYLSYKVFKLNQREVEPADIEIKQWENPKSKIEDNGIIDLKPVVLTFVNSGKGDGLLKSVNVKPNVTGETLTEIVDGDYEGTFQYEISEENSFPIEIPSGEEKQISVTIFQPREVSGLTITHDSSGESKPAQYIPVPDPE